MAKQSQLDKAIAQIEMEIAVLEAARSRLMEAKTSPFKRVSRKRLKRYCGMCDEYMNQTECPKCGQKTDRVPHDAETPTLAEA